MAGATGTCLVGAFEDRAAAERAVSELRSAGIGGDEIGYAIRGADAVRGGMITDAVGTKDGQGMLSGALAGGVLGGLAGAAAAMLVPGVGPVLAAGVLWTALGGAGAGAATGGLLGAMAGLGVSEDEARFYEQEFNSGRAIVSVRPGPRAADAADILRRHGGYDLHNRAGGRLPPSSASVPEAAASPQPQT